MTTEDGHDVLSCVHALTWCLPGGTTPITSRTRITIITNYHDATSPNVITANIELWRETGWIMMEEMFNESMHYEFNSREDVENYCLEVLELFFTGKLSNTDNDIPPATPSFKKRNKNKKKDVDRDPDPDKPTETKGPEIMPDLILEKSSSMPDFDWL